MTGPMMTRTLTHDRLLEVLDYDPATGVFTWKVRLSRKFPVGRSAGGVRKGSRTSTFYVRIDEHDYTGARLAWFYVTGKWPHRLKLKDGDITNCRFDNLEQTMALPKKYDHTTPEGRAQYLRDHYREFSGARRDALLRRQFGISLADYQTKHADQNGCCSICGAPETGTRNGKTITLAVDHNHATGAVRDLLCRGCNQLIGNAREDIAVLQSAIAYLRRHQPDEPVPTSFVPYHADLGVMLH